MSTSMNEGLSVGYINNSSHGLVSGPPQASGGGGGGFAIAPGNAPPPTAFSLWMERNNPFQRVDKLLPGEHGTRFKQVMCLSLVMFALGIADLALTGPCFSLSYISILHIFTVVLPLCDFITQPTLNAMFNVANTVFQFVTIFVRVGQSCNRLEYIGLNAGQIVVGMGIIYLLSELDPTIEDKSREFLASCACNTPQIEETEPGAGPARKPKVKLSIAESDTSEPRRRTLIDSVRWRPEFVIQAKNGTKIDEAIV